MDRIESSTPQLRQMFLGECERVQYLFDDMGHPRFRDTEIIPVALGIMSLYLSESEIRKLADSVSITQGLSADSDFAMVARSALALHKLGLGIVDREEAIKKRDQLSKAEAHIKKLEAELASANERIHRMRVGA